MNISCMRCQRVLKLEVTVGDETYTDTDEDVGVEISMETPGVLKAICYDCMSGREAWQQLMESAAALLDASEEYIADMDMLRERIPSMRDHPEAKAAYAQAQERARQARAALEALRKNEPEDEE